MRRVKKSQQCDRGTDYDHHDFYSVDKKYDVDNHSYYDDDDDTDEMNWLCSKGKNNNLNVSFKKPRRFECMIITLIMMTMASYDDDQE